MNNTPPSIKYPEHPIMIGLWISTLYTKKDVIALFSNKSTGLILYSNIHLQRGMSAVHYAAESGEMEVLQHLLDSGADMNEKDAVGTAWVAFL